MRRARGLLFLALILRAADSSSQTGYSTAPSTAAPQAADAKGRTMLRQFTLIESRYDLTQEIDRDGASMTRGKYLAAGPVAKGKGFPYLPLPHPAPETGHFIFPNNYSSIHPEFARTDADFDLPDTYMPERPAPMFLTTRPDLGDVSQGREITLENYAWLLDQVLTPLQLEGMRLLLTPRPTLWFNRSKHRLTALPAPGAACFSCHVNGHTNGAIALEPATRPRAEAVRLDTPSLRGSGRAGLLGSKRAIHSLSEFAEVEDYFEQETALAKQIGARPLTHEESIAVSAMMSIIDFPPDPKLGLEGRLEAGRATASERAGEKLFFGKARCSACHPAPFYSDNEMHDLRVERLTGGKAEGAFKTPTLRTIKDSPPYFHDGRLPTLEDSVEFFDRVLDLKLSKPEKTSLSDFLKAL